MAIATKLEAVIVTCHHGMKQKAFMFTSMTACEVCKKKDQKYQGSHGTK